ncbi:MAG: ribonuclease Y [Patescibacteria group bacterium]|nr:ribonuclease Y [Patescibacteria group bacterium]
MTQLNLLLLGIFSLSIGSILGYYARQSIAKRDWKTIEARIQKRIRKAAEERDKILTQAKDKASQILGETEKSERDRRKTLFSTEQMLLKREDIINKKISDFDTNQKEFQEKVEKLKQIKESLKELRGKAIEGLEKISGLNKKEAKDELFKNLEKEYKIDILERINKLEKEGHERFEKRAKDLLVTAIQKYALSQAQEITTTTVPLPNEEIKGRIIGKEGRNIRALEGLTGVELIVDETPETVVISGFDPIRRHVAKIALEKLILDGRIQPARIEEKVKEARAEIASQVQKAGETATYELGIIGLDPKLVQLIGRLKFRTSYAQNVLLHSIEVAYLASFLAEEIGANPLVAKMGGLFHDIGKAVDHQIEGSHVNIGIKILEKFGIEKEVIDAMKSHHEEYPYESIEAIIVQVADQISGARPGARKDTLENYIKRLSDLEGIATSFPGVEKAWALQAGREIRVFVRPQLIDDTEAKKLAREIAKKIQEELRYPGEIKVTLIRETKIIDYAK